MALTLSAANPDHSTLNRPNDPRDPNGISRATRSGGTGAQTKADRAVTKLKYAIWVQAWKDACGGDASHELEFTVSGSAITYADD